MIRTIIFILMAAFAIAANAQNAEQIVNQEDVDYANSLNNSGIHYYNSGDYVQAEKYYLEAKDIWEKVLGKEHPDYATLLNNLGLLYGDWGDYAQAEKYLLEAKNIRKKVLDKEHPNYAISLNNLGTFYFNLGDYAHSEKYYLEAKDILEKVLGKEHSDYAISLNNLGLLYSKLGNYTQAEKYYLEANNILGKVLGKEHPDYVASLNNLGGFYNELGNYVQAEKYYLKAKDIWEKVLGKEHPNYALSINNLGWLYSNLSDYVQAEKYFLEAKNIFGKILGKEHPNYATSINNLGLLYYKLGDYTQAEKYYLEAKNSWEKAFGEEHSSYAVSINNLGVLYYKLGDYTQAEKYYLEVKNIREKVLGKGHPDYATSINNLGLLYYDLGNYAQAEKYFLEAKNIREKVLGKEHPDYALSLNNLGAFYSNLSDYTQSERYHLEAKNIYEKVLGNKHPNYAISLNNLGVLYRTLGDYTQSEKYHLEAKNIREKVLGKEHPDYALSLNNLGLLYFDLGNYTQAEKYYLETKNSWGKVLGKEHPNYALSLNNLGVLYSKLEDYAQAEKYYLEAKNSWEKVLGKEHPNYALSLNNLGLLYSDLSDYAQAEKYYLEAKNSWEKALGKEHLNYAISLNNIKLLYQNTKEYEKSTVLNNEVCELTIKSVDKNFAFLSEQQRNQYWKTQEGVFIGSYSLSWVYPVPSVTGLNYNNTLFTKGLLLRTTNDIREIIYLSKNQSLINNFEQLGNLRQQIINLQQKENYDKDYVQKLETRADSLDKAVTQVSQAYCDLKADMSMTWQDVQKQLKSNEAAIEFVSFQLYDKNWTDSTMYAALVLRPNMETPVWIPLCEQKELQEILQPTVNDTKLQTENLYVYGGKKLYQLVWQAIEKELSDVKTVYYSPSGLLHKIAFSAIPTDGENELLSDKYDLHLLSSTREIARLKKETPASLMQDATVIYGGLTYDKQQLAYHQPKKQEPETKKRYIDKDRRRDAELPAAELRSGFSEWKYLAGTKAEAEQIVSSLESKRIPYQSYSEDKGNEESFKELSNTKTGVIHLATHGFFLPDIENKVIENLVQRLGGSKEKPFENPLLRSGLIMSGANEQWIAKEYITDEDMEDGILTADEISRLNLTKTKLVVMSACETGLGDAKNSEGVFGLQRAFKLAGVESLIMSLWKVPDDATAELMTTFYNEWLKGQTKQSAFKAAQEKIRRNEKYKSPYYWAAFVMMD